MSAQQCSFIKNTKRENTLYAPLSNIKSFAIANAAVFGLCLYACSWYVNRVHIFVCDFVDAEGSVELMEIAHKKWQCECWIYVLCLKVTSNWHWFVTQCFQFSHACICLVACVRSIIARESIGFLGIFCTCASTHDTNSHYLIARNKTNISPNVSDGISSSAIVFVARCHCFVRVNALFVFGCS